VRSGALRGVT